jgi:hypothetical protein
MLQVWSAAGIAATALNESEIDSDNVVAFEVMTDIYV